MNAENQVWQLREVRKRRLGRSLIAIFAIALSAVGIQEPLAAQSTAQAQVDNAVHEIVKAYNDNNYEKYFSIFADDITIFRGARGR
jgi:hypothetical protein